MKIRHPMRLHQPVACMQQDEFLHETEWGGGSTPPCFSPYPFRASSCILKEEWDSDGCVSLVLCGMKHVFNDSE